MKFKIEKDLKPIYINTFLIFPKEFNGYRYWLCWVTIKYEYIKILNRYSRFGEIVSIGRNAKDYKL